MTSVVYTNLNGDAPVVRWGGHVFADGVPVDVDDAALIAKARNNPFFTVGDEAASEAPKRRGRPPKVRADETETDGEDAE